MLYFSELKEVAVIDQNDVYIGVVADMVFRCVSTAPVTKILVRQLSGVQLLLPVSAIIKISQVIRIQTEIEPTILEENELFIGKNITDQQIIDISGSKIVRVNDVVLVQTPGLHITGVDVGILGILRWFGIEDIFCKAARIFHHPINPRFLSWADVAPLELARGRVMMRKQETNLKKLNPEDLADHLDKTNIRNVRRILGLLDESYAAEVINNLNPSFQTALFKSFPADKSAKVLSLLDPDEAVDIILTLDRHARSRILSLFESEKHDQIAKLIALSHTPIGDIISIEFTSVAADATVRQVKAILSQELESQVESSNVYVTNQTNQLVGVFNLHELLAHSEDTQVYKFMVQNLVVIHLSTPKEIAWKKMVKYKFGYLPVVDGEKKMVGVVRWFDTVDEKLQN
ncbi:MAG: CBS domain-containing protein [bacterium]